MTEQWTSKDNSTQAGKSALRLKYLPQEAHVLDLFCGKGNMYKDVYKNRAQTYLGIDKKKIHDKNICKLMNNEKYVRENDLDQFNVFDLDAYGTPWKLLYLIIKKLKAGDYTFYITDGLVTYQKMNGKVTNFISATEKIPKGMNIPGINRFYVDMFTTMLRDLETRFDCTVEKAACFHNEKRTVYYWMLKIKKNTS